MHDFLLAKEIIDEILKIVKEKKITMVKRVSVEIGQIALSHDGYEEHAEDINIENLRFGLESISKNTLLEFTVFDIKKVPGENWRLVKLEAE